MPPPWDQIPGAFGRPPVPGTSGGDDTYGGQDEDRERVRRQAGLASDFADLGQAQYGRRGQHLDLAFDRLGALAEGRESITGEQLRQGLAANMASQQSQAAGARGGNAAMAARTASRNAASLGSGLAGQQTLAGIAERDAANRALIGGMSTARDQDLRAGTISRGQAIQGIGQALGNPNQPTDYTPYIAGAAALGAAALSDRRAKVGIKPADADAQELARALGAYSYDYRNKANGQGRRLGVMAQDVEGTKFGRQIVRDGPGGAKMLDSAQLASALAAVSGNLNKRVERLEGSG